MELRNSGHGGLNMTKRAEQIVWRHRRPMQTRMAVAQFLCVGLVLSCAILGVWTRTYSIHLGYDLSKVTNCLSDLEHRQEELLVEVQTLTNPQRIGWLAMRDLGFKRPLPAQIVFVE